MGNTLRIGTRGSPLALKQTEIFIRSLATIGVYDVEVIPIKTTGDRIVDRPLADIGGKALFAKEIQQTLFEGKIDCAVHSLKDLDGQMPWEMIAAVLKRGDPRDGLLSREGLKLMDLPLGARIGTCSPRREAQLKALRPDFVISPIRGNVQTRIQQVRDCKYDATLLAVVGLERLNLKHELTEIFEPEMFLPAAGQGVIAIQVLPENKKITDLLAPLSHSETMDCCIAERTVLRQIDGDCRTSIAAYATRCSENIITLKAKLWKEDSFVYSDESGTNPIVVANKVAAELLK